MNDFSSVAAVCPDAVLSFTGDDAQTWLAGQTTNDLTPLFEDKQDAIYTLFVTAKGRILADGWVSKNSEGVFVASVPAASVSDLSEHFERYIIMEDVEVERLPVSVLSVVDAEVSAALRDKFDHHQARDLGLPSTRLLVPTESAENALKALGEGSIRILDEDEWEAAKVAVGEPRFGHDFSAEHYPQEAGLGGSAVSFNKGCYIGQEVVCMLENRGKFRRQLTWLELAEPASDGAEVRSGEESVGQVTSQASWGGKHFAIAMIARKALEAPDALRVGSQKPSSVRPVGQA